MIHDLHAFCFQQAPSVWYWELWHSGLCEWNSNNVIVDVTDTPDDARTVWKSVPWYTAQHGVIWSAQKHDKNSFREAIYCLLSTLKSLHSDSLIHLNANLLRLCLNHLWMHASQCNCVIIEKQVSELEGWRTIVAGSVWLGASGLCSACLSSQQDAEPMPESTSGETASAALMDLS